MFICVQLVCVFLCIKKVCVFVCVFVKVKWIVCFILFLEPDHFKDGEIFFISQKPNGSQVDVKITFKVSDGILWSESLHVSINQF